MSIANQSRPADVQAAEQHFNNAHSPAEAVRNLIADVQNILKSTPDRMQANEKIRELNEDLHLGDQNLPPMQIVTAKGNDLVLKDPTQKDHFIVLDGQAKQKFEGSRQDAMDLVKKDAAGQDASKGPGDGTQPQTDTTKTDTTKTDATKIDATKTDTTKADATKTDDTKTDDTKTDATKTDAPKTDDRAQVQSDYWQAHERQDNDDGTSDVTVKKGDNLWKIAEHVAEERLGHKMDPKNLKDMLAVQRLTKELAAAQDPPIEIKDGKALIKDGDTIHIPAAKDSKVQPEAKPGDTTNPAPDTAENPGHPSKHGQVETSGKTTTVKEENGAETKVTVDDKGDPTDVTLNGGHWKDTPSAGHWKKTGDHQWTNDSGSQWHGDITLGKDGTYTAKDLDTGVTKSNHPDGSAVVLDKNDQPTSVQSADGPHKHTYTKGDDGKWTSQPGSEKFDDVSLDKDGTVTGKIGDGTKKMYADGSQLDTDENGKTTFLQTPDGPHQQSFTKDSTSGKFTANPGGDQYDDVSMDDSGNVTAKMGDGTKQMFNDGSQRDTDENDKTTFVQTPDGPHQKSFTKDKTTGKFTSNPGAEQFDDASMDNDGNITAKIGDGQKKYYPDGHQIDTDEKGNTTFIQSADGPHQESYVKGEDGKWLSNPGKEQLTDVQMDDKGDVITKDANGMTKTHYADGSQVDVDGQGRMTYMRTADGGQYQMTYNYDDSTVPATITGPNGDYDLDSDGRYYMHNGERVKVAVKPGSISAESAKGKVQATAGDGDTSDQ